MGFTEFAKKHPYTPIILVCSAFIVANAAGPSIVFLERMQTKAKAAGLDGFDWCICAVYHAGLIGTTILAFRSRKFGDFQNEQQKKANGTEVVKSSDADQTGRLKTLG